jgi:UDP-GlcNAc:undecaprenyl-phosphate GlcNAc-1-phosphate transferase
VAGYSIVLAVAAIGTYLATFVVRRVAVRVGAVVKPDERRVHDKPTPTAGGAAMYLAFLVAMVVASAIPQFRPVFRGSSEPLGIVLAATVIFAVGLVDDLREVSAPAKLAGMVLAGSVLYFLGVTMFYFRVPFADFVALSADLIPLLTVIWVAGMANALNLIDGLDGLAAGIVAIAAGTFFVYGDRLFKAGLLPPDNVGPLISIIALGVCLGFLPHNFHPARIFMGDAGSMFLGLLMASSTMVVGGRTADQFSGQTYFFFAPIFIPFFILGVPIFDTAFAIVRRSIKRGGFHVADKEHLHHRLMRLGHGHRRSVVILWAWTGILSGLVLLPTFTNQGNAILPFAVLALGVALYTMFHPGIRQRGEQDVLDRAESLAHEAADDEGGPPTQAALAPVVPIQERRSAQ